MQRNFDMNPVTLGLHNNTLYEPQRTNNFEVYLYIPPIIANNDAQRSQDVNKYITLATESFTLPNITVQPVDINYGNAKIHLAGNISYGGADSLSCVDYIGADVEGILYAWLNLVHSPETGQVGWAANYKTDGKVLEFSADGACLACWILRGVWISGVNPGDMAKGNSDLKKVTAQVQYDLAYRKFGESTRNTHEAAAAQALNDMNWKNQADYPDTNAGGPIQAVKDSFN